MRELLLHIGHDKTGTSYLQNTYQLNSACLLEKHGIYYRKNEKKNVRSFGAIGAGNAVELLYSPQNLASALKEDGRVSNRLLYSSEYIFYWLKEHKDLRFISEVAMDLGFDRVRIILFIRNPLGHASSSWQQLVKRGLINSSINLFYQSYRVPEDVFSVLNKLQTQNNLEVTVMNYSKCSNALLETVAHWLAIPSQALTPLPIASVNRSLTKGELAFLLKLNGTIGPRTSFVVDALCERLPEQKPDEIRPPHEVQLATIERLRPAMERVNSRIPADQHYDSDIKASYPICDPLDLSLEQIEVLSEALGTRIAKLQNTLDATRLDPGSHVSGRKLLSGLAKRVSHRLPVPGLLRREQTQE